MSEAIEMKTEHQWLFEELYLEAFPKVAYFVSSRNGSFEDARDVFQDALVIFYEKATTAGFEFHTSREAYLLGIARHLWFRKYSKDVKSRPLAEGDEYLPMDDNHQVDDVRILRLLEQTGKKCLHLLQSFYYDQLSLKKIAEKLGYGSERTATVQKYKCLEKVRDTIKEKSIEYADFIN